MVAPRGSDMNFNPEDYHPERGSDWDWRSCPNCGSRDALAVDEANAEDVYYRVYAICGPSDGPCNQSWVIQFDEDLDRDHETGAEFPWALDVWDLRGPDQELETC